MTMKAWLSGVGQGLRAVWTLIEETSRQESVRPGEGENPPPPLPSPEANASQCLRPHPHEGACVLPVFDGERCAPP